MPLNNYAFYAGLLAGVVLAATFLIWFIRRNNHRHSLARVIRKISKESLSDFIIPDGLDGEIQIDHLLLTSRGMLVLDIKDFRGRLYGGDNMDDWTVINQSQRFTFVNPVGPLRERVIAIKTLLKDVPVEGRVVMLGDIELSDDLPAMVVTVPQLLAQFNADEKLTLNSLRAFYPHWEQLQKIATPA